MIKKIIVPITITVLMIIYYVVYFTFFAVIIPYFWLKIIFVIVPIILSAIMIFVCIERIKEIKGGEEDDLSKY